jgi:hypothetical protein
MHWIYGSEEYWRDGKLRIRYNPDLLDHPGTICDIARKKA